MEDRIQPETSAPALRPGAADSPRPDNGSRRYRTRLAGTLFGAWVGIPLGALAVAVCYWLTDFGDYAWDGALHGALGGLLGGAVIGFVERTIRGDLVKPDVGTVIGFLFGLAVAPVVLLGIRGGTVYVIAGIFCAGPMGGLLFGAMLDRAYEESLRQRWASAIAFGSFGIAACVGIVFLIANYSDPAPEEVAKGAWKLVSDTWSEDPEMNDAKIRKITLYRPEHRTYTGIMEASLAGKVQVFDMEVHVRHNTTKVEWLLRD